MDLCQALGYWPGTTLDGKSCNYEAPMQDPVEEIEVGLVAELHALRLDKRGLPEVLLQYDRLESETAARLREHGAGNLVIELQRTLAAARLSAARSKNADTRPQPSCLRDQMSLATTRRRSGSWRSQSSRAFV